MIHHHVGNRSPQLQIFVVAALAVMLVIVAAFAVTAVAVPAGNTAPIRPSAPSLPISSTPVSENEANRLVWSLPEVQAAAEQLRSRGSRPITYTASKPLQSNNAGDRQAFYVIKFAEDRDGQVTTINTFNVDAHTRQITVYDVVEDSTISLEQWRAGRPR